MKELHEIAAEWLKTNGYDGLFLVSECACEIDELMPCGEPHPDCEAGYKTKDNPDSGYDFMIGPEKEATATTRLQPSHMKGD